MMIVKFYDEVDDSLLKFAVIITKTNGKWVFCKHKKRSTWEVPGGHRESGESITETAKRELYEETGAKNMILDQFVYILLLPQIISMVKKLLECYFMRMFFLLKKNYIVK